MQNFHFIMGLSAGLLSLLAFIPYALAMLGGTNRPNRATWIIWMVLGFILLGSYQAAGATHALWLSVANAMAFSVIVILSFKYGEGGWSIFDLSCLAAALLGVGMWWYFSSPLLALYLSVVIDFVGALPTIKKSFENPRSENFSAWLMFWLANSLNLFAVEKWSLAMGLYPAYMFGITGLVTIILWRRRKFL